MPTVLIIEDDLTIRNGLQRLLKQEGYQVYFAENGAKGLEIATTIVPDIIMCDVSMPAMDGYAVLKAVKNNPALAEKPFIFLSAKTTEQDIVHGKNLGAITYLLKPMWPEDIMNTIKNILALTPASAPAPATTVPGTTPKTTTMA
jgi:DNA-binding response OmpR family regulator